MSVCVTLCVCLCVRCVYVWEWRGEFNRAVLVVQLDLIFHFILNPEQRRVFQLVENINHKYVLRNARLQCIMYGPAQCVLFKYIWTYESSFRR
jgi:hypothetical protein